MIIIVQGRYTTEAMAGMVAKPEDRGKEAKRLIEAAGGKFLGSYFTFGEFDFLVVSEFNDPQAPAAAVIASAVGGSLAVTKTTVGMDWNDAKAAFAAAAKVGKSFRSAGKKK